MLVESEVGTFQNTRRVVVLGRTALDEHAGEEAEGDERDEHSFVLASVASCSCFYSFLLAAMGGSTRRTCDLSVDITSQVARF